MKQLWARAGNAASSGPVMAALLKEAAGGARNAFTQPHAKSLGSVLAAAAGGAGMKAEHHLDALRAAVQVVEAVRKVCTEAGKKLAVLVGAEWLNAVAKAVVTVRELGVSDRVNTQLSRLIQVMGIAELVAVAQPDPALKMRLAKAQAARAEAASKPKNGHRKQR
ncbi:uncharacterized protein HaLaN_16503 [Haematococcus lacustris]|uniref:Uncharacterized protein n=1 Tax=Haematococcus lacustris TaxID=44745 RepID=A0A699ZUC9_HAELA|nr:uncharacterized protein HaLaN_16503 [Haematococcus lacustris]